MASFSPFIGVLLPFAIAKKLALNSHGDRACYQDYAYVALILNSSPRQHFRLENERLQSSVSALLRGRVDDRIAPSFGSDSMPANNAASCSEVGVSASTASRLPSDSGASSRANPAAGSI